MSQSKAPLLETIDFSSMHFTEPKSSTKDGKSFIPMVFTQVSESSRENVRFQICRPPRELLVPGTSKKERDQLLKKLPYIRSAYHLQEKPKYEVKDGKRLLYIAVSPEVAEAMSALDKRNVQAIVDNVEPWFRRGKLDPAIVKGQYCSVVTKYPTSHEIPDEKKDVAIRCKVIEGETEILVQTEPGSKEVREGTHMDLLMGARVIPVFRVQGLYFRSIESGCILNCEKILVLHSDALSANLDFDLGDDMELERIQDFVPPGTGVDFEANDGPDGLDVEPSVSEGTVVNAPPSWSADNGNVVLY